MSDCIQRILTKVSVVATKEGIDAERYKQPSKQVEMTCSIFYIAKLKYRNETFTHVHM